MSPSNIGNFSATNSEDRHFVWVIPKFSSLKMDEKYNSNYATTFQGVKFHLHLTIEKPGYIGVYVRFKKHHIPKYSYYFENSKRESMRQHTAHTIPPSVKRCGHWNVCSRNDMIEFLGNDDVLTINFIIDNDDVVLKQLSDRKTVSVEWTIPNLYAQNLNPLSSSSFIIGNTSVVARLDIKRNTADLIAQVTPDSIQSLVVFIFGQANTVPPHSIELLNTAGKVYAQERMKPCGAAQTLIVKKDIVDEHLDRDGALRVRVAFFLINPLEVLNFHSPAVGAPPAGPHPSINHGPKASFFGTKGSYTRMVDQ